MTGNQYINKIDFLQTSPARDRSRIFFIERETPTMGFLHELVQICIRRLFVFLSRRPRLYRDEDEMLISDMNCLPLSSLIRSRSSIRIVFSDCMQEEI